MMIQYKKFLLAFLLGILLLPKFQAYGQCNACGQTPQRMQKYIDVMNQLLEFTPRSEFNEKFAPVQRVQNALKTANNDLVDILIDLPVDDEDGGEELLMATLVRSRDYFKLQEIDQLISLKLLSLSGIELIGNDLLPISEEEAAQFNSILSQLGFVEWAREGDEIALVGESYRAYLGMLRRLNSVMKHLHRDMYRYHEYLTSVGKGAVKSATNQANDTFDAGDAELLKLAYVDLRWRLGEPYAERFETESSNESISLLHYKRNYQDMLLWIWGLQRDYECSVGARGLCETWSKTAEASWNMVKERRQNDGKSAAHVFNDAWARLKGVMWFADDESKEASQRRQEQLMSQYWGDDFPQERKRRELARVNYEEDEVANSPVSLQRLVKEIFKKRAEGSDDIDSLDPNESGASESGMQPVIGAQAESQDNLRNADTDEKRKSYLETNFYGYFDRDERKKRRDGELDMRDYFTSSTIDQEKRAITTAAMNVIAAQEALDIQSLVYDVTDVTKQFPSLSYALYANANQWGDKHDPQSDTPTIYTAAQSVCENQCSNIQDKQCGSLGE